MHNRRVEQATRLEVLDERGGRLIGFAATIHEVALNAFVIVPDLTVDEKLHETDATLDKAAGNEATRAIFAGDGFVQAVKLLSGLAFSCEIERLLRGGLHSRGKFVTGNARFQVRLTRMTRQMIAIEPCEEGQVFFLQSAFQVRRWLEVENARFGRAHDRSLKQRRQPT